MNRIYIIPALLLTACPFVSEGAPMDMDASSSSSGSDDDESDTTVSTTLTTNATSTTTSNSEVTGESCDMPDVTCGVGACAVTVSGCDDEGELAQCHADMPVAEKCNGIDDDCDGVVDDLPQKACKSSCGLGTMDCNDGKWSECGATQPEAETCNVSDDDCDGDVDEGVSDCRVDVHRSWHPTTGDHLYTLDLEEAECCGYDLEFVDFFALYAEEQPGTTEFYRCTGPVLHHYTIDPDCEGLQLESVMGYIGTEDLLGSVPLWRLHNPQTDAHLFTPNQDEREQAISVFGYVDEGAVGWVW